MLWTLTAYLITKSQMSVTQLPETVVLDVLGDRCCHVYVIFGPLQMLIPYLFLQLTLTRFMHSMHKVWSNINLSDRLAQFLVPEHRVDVAV